ncbi:MAG: hypothetical protein J5449_11875 [Oscillospiraceae bacterium]|nr:hypothetical protein [Oscillospiraceae bacterium]
MGKEVHFALKRGTKLSDEEIAMIEAARNLPESLDEDNPPIDPVATPEQYNALMRAVAERNRRVTKHGRGSAESLTTA